MEYREPAELTNRITSRQLKPLDSNVVEQKPQHVSITVVAIIAQYRKSGRYDLRAYCECVPRNVHLTQNASETVPYCSFDIFLVQQLVLPVRALPLSVTRVRSFSQRRNCQGDHRHRRCARRAAGACRCTAVNPRLAVLFSSTMLSGDGCIQSRCRAHYQPRFSPYPIRRQAASRRALCQCPCVMHV